MSSFSWYSNMFLNQYEIKGRYLIKFFDSYVLTNKPAKKLLPILFFFNFWLYGEFYVLKKKLRSFVTPSSSFFLLFSFYNNNNQVQFSFFNTVSTFYNGIGFRDFSPVLIWPSSLKQFIAPFTKRFSSFVSLRKCYY